MSLPTNVIAPQGIVIPEGKMLVVQGRIFVPALSSSPNIFTDEVEFLQGNIRYVQPHNLDHYLEDDLDSLKIELTVGSKSMTPVHIIREEIGGFTVDFIRAENVLGIEQQFIFIMRNEVIDESIQSAAKDHYRSPADLQPGTDPAPANDTHTPAAPDGIEPPSDPPAN